MPMKILVVSDTHGNNTNLRKAVANMGGSLDLMVHLGYIMCSLDVIREIAGCPVEIVKGNCDSFPDIQSARLIDIAGHKAFITHGHLYGGNWGIGTMKDIAKENGAEIVMFGHTHEPMVDKTPGMTVINPGSLSRPRQDGGRPTYIVMSVSGNGSTDYSLVYM